MTAPSDSLWPAMATGFAEMWSSEHNPDSVPDLVVFDFADLPPPQRPEVKLGPLDFGLVSISHWGVFDLGRFGGVALSGRVEWQHAGEPVSIIPCDPRAFADFMRPVAR